MTPPADLSGVGTLQHSTASRRPSLGYVIVGALVAAFLGLRWGGIRRGIWIDLDVYIRGAAAVLRHEPLYAVSVQGQPFTYPPFAALRFVALRLTPPRSGWAQCSLHATHGSSGAAVSSTCRASARKPSSGATTSR